MTDDERRQHRADVLNEAATAIHAMRPAFSAGMRQFDAGMQTAEDIVRVLIDDSEAAAS